MDLAKHWRLRSARYRLEGLRHTSSGVVRFPPEGVPTAEAADWQPYALNGRGSIYSFSIVRQPPAGFDEEVPYIVALIRLEEGPMVTAQLTDCDIEQAAIDLPVEMVTRKLKDVGPEGLIVYGYKFRPVL